MQFLKQISHSFLAIVADVFARTARTFLEDPPALLTNRFEASPALST
jgi:hypothetical protein